MFRVVRMEIYLNDCTSLKEKRQILQSLIDKCKKFNISIAETAALDMWNYSEITFSIVSNSEQFNQRIIDKVINLFDNEFRLKIVNIEMLY